MWFTRVSIHNPVFATMMMAALLVLGLFSYNRLPVEQFPDVSFPVVVVQTEYPGASPENVEEEVTRKVEESVNTISGIKTLSSRSYEGLSVVIVEFDLSVEQILMLRNQQVLLETQSSLRRSIRLRNPYVDPMSLLQVDLLRRWRATDRKDTELFDALIASINGIARGLQDSG